MEMDFKVGDYAKFTRKIRGVKLIVGNSYEVVKVYKTTVRLRDWNQDWTIPFEAIEKVEVYGDPIMQPFDGAKVGVQK
ncbi:hypothetical protein [Paenilisteria newyorkensis]|uniref:hypothetical protein n=1 Tax=Listeria newyorkensis TaxID=1497681 RepID=UPI000669F447|nr:hypothetical protein [Listeria newyorkensis]KMT62686.1 hypothetical protein X559_0969 [Listeria newyorkensis]